MFARITWFQVSPDRIDQGITTTRERAWPALSAMNGNLGFVLLANRETGACAGISYWDNMENLRASEEASATLRSQTASEAGLTIGEIDRFEQILQERAAPPVANHFIRVNDLQGAPDKIDQVANIVRDTIPTLRAQNGFRAVLVGANRQTGRILISSVWETAADREASNAAVQARRNEIAQVVGTTDVKLNLYESVFTQVKQAALV